MSLNFFRRVAFGLSPSDKKPDDPLPWALNQLNTVPKFLWPGSIPTEKELRKKYGEWVYGDREFLRREVFWGDDLPNLTEELFKI